MSQTILQFTDVSYSYAHAAGAVLSHVSFSVRQGEFLGILGADDAGKTTLARLSNGLLIPQTGSITVFPVMEDSHKAATPLIVNSNTLPHIRRMIGVVFSDPEHQIVGTTVEEDMAFGLGNLGVPPKEMRQRIDRYLRETGLLQAAKQAPHTLSGGEQQKLCIAGILAMQPRCLVLDEPLSFLDGKNRQHILTLLRKLNMQGTTILYLTSDPEELRDAQRILLLHHAAIQGEYTLPALWNSPRHVAKTALLPPDMMQFRHQLRETGYPVHDSSLLPTEVARDICM